jgi:hypothetical protein
MPFATVIRCHDLIASNKNKRVNVHMFAGGVNVFDAKVGKRPESIANESSTRLR